MRKNYKYQNFRMDHLLLLYKCNIINILKGQCHKISLFLFSFLNPTHPIHPDSSLVNTAQSLSMHCTYNTAWSQPKKMQENSLQSESTHSALPDSALYLETRHSQMFVFCY